MGEFFLFLFLLTVHGRSFLCAFTFWEMMGV